MPDYPCPHGRASWTICPHCNNQWGAAPVESMGYTLTATGWPPWATSSYIIWHPAHEPSRLRPGKLARRRRRDAKRRLLRAAARIFARNPIWQRMQENKR